jgi:competence ComEA-like helix-hairpin-helix protein
MRDFLKDYFSFTRKERTAVILLVMIIVVIFILPYLIPEERGVDDKDLLQIYKKASMQNDSANSIVYNKSESQNPRSFKYYNASGKKGQTDFFPFDPNTLSSEGWRKLGLRDKTISTIRNYLAKGGSFKSPEDISRIYGIPPALGEKLKPFVSIKSTEKINPPLKSYSDIKYEKAGQSKDEYLKTIVDINLADSTAFEKLPGIGPKLASRIVNFRDKLGGFYQVEQVAETYGLADSVFQKIRSKLIMGSTTVKQININNADSKELHKHPYIGWNIANAIVQYRQQHGPFSELTEVLQIDLFTHETFQKLSPYLSVTPNKK